MKKYLWLGLWYCLIFAPSLVAKASDSAIQYETKIEKNFIVKKTIYTDELLKISPEVKDIFSEEEILSVYLDGEPLIKNGSRVIQSLLIYRNIQIKNTLWFAEGELRSVKGFILEDIDWLESFFIIIAPILLVCMFPTVLPIRSTSCFLAGLSALFVSVEISGLLLILALILMFSWIVIASVEFTYADDKSFVNFVSNISIPVFIFVGFWLAYRFYRVDGIQILPSLMLEFTILCAVLFILEIVPINGVLGSRMRKIWQEFSVL